MFSFPKINFILQKGISQLEDIIFKLTPYGIKIRYCLKFHAGLTKPGSVFQASWIRIRLQIEEVLAASNLHLSLSSDSTNLHYYYFALHGQYSGTL